MHAGSMYNPCGACNAACRLQAMAPPNEAFVRDIQPNDSFLIGRCVITLSASPVSFKVRDMHGLSCSAHALVIVRGKAVAHAIATLVECMCK